MKCIGRLNDIKVWDISYYRTNAIDERELFTSKILAFTSEDALKSIKTH